MVKYLFTNKTASDAPREGVWSILSTSTSSPVGRATSAEDALNIYCAARARRTAHLPESQRVTYTWEPATLPGVYTLTVTRASGLTLAGDVIVVTSF